MRTVDFKLKPNTTRPFRCMGVLLFLTLMVLWCRPVMAAPQVQEDDQAYSVGVSAHLVPFYAENEKGEPVFDLKQEEITLLVNRKESPLMYLSRFRFDIKEGAAEGGKAVPAKPKKMDAGRYIFIVVDSIFNNSYGLKRANAICRDIIAKSSPEDAFILMENLPDIGLKYIAGPTHDPVKLEAAIAAMNEMGLAAIKKQEMRFKNYGGGQIRKYLVSSDIATATQNKEAFIDLSAMENQHADFIRRRTTNARAKLLTRSLNQLQYALKTIERPKMVYLISSGVRTSILDLEEMEFYFKLLSKAAEAINRSGSLLYVVNSSIENPDIPVRYTGKETLASLAKSANGKYFSGNDVERVAQQISDSTAAYYEIAFSPGTDKTMDIEIQCKRPGINIFTVTKTEKARPYGQMKKLQKKLFALSVVTGGSWARMAGRVKLQTFEGKKITAHEADITIQLPEDFKNKPLDAYIINIDPGTLKADFKISTVKSESSINLKGKFQKDRRLYFVLIDPQTAECRFNLIK